MPKTQLKKYPWRPLYAGDAKWADIFLVPPAPFKVWMFHYWMEGENNCSWPTVPTIMKECGLSKNTVQGARRWLIENGWLKLVGFTDFGVPKYKVKRGAIPEIGTPPQNLGVPENGLPPIPEIGTTPTPKSVPLTISIEPTAFEPAAVEVVSESGSQGAPTASGLSSEDQNLETLFSEEPTQVQTLFSLLYPSGFESVALFNREAPHARACAEILAKENISATELLKYNKMHKSGGLVIRTCAQFHKALTAESQRLLNDFVGHDASSCKACKALLKKDSNGKPLPSYRQTSRGAEIFGKGSI
jgi:hypothetical protein